MFTGIVTDVGRIETISGGPDLKRIAISTRYDTSTIDIGASIMVNGICLTAVAFAPNRFDAELGAETLAVTTAANWHEGQAVNLERSLRAGDELGGHIVSGHVDGVATILRREELDGMARIDLLSPEPLARFIAVKGSIALDGISLTVNRAEGAEFSVLLIPHTLSVTSWRGIAAGDKVNLEVDMLARYVARLAEFR